MKKICFLLVFILSFVFCIPAFATADPTVSAWDGVVPAANPAYTFSGGSGTEADPYLIGSAADLIQLAVNVCNLTTYHNVYFRMTVDVDCGEKDGWLPIGGNTVGNNSDATYVDASFCGVFDGDGHVVKNWKINEPLWHSGFFGQTMGATVKNLGIESGSIFSKKSWVGGLIGLALDTTVQNCYTKADVKIERTGGTATAGGLIGKAQGNMKVENCYATGDVTVLTGSAAGGNVGGLIGVYGGGPSSEVKNCWSTGDVLGKNAHAGGMFGTVTGNSTVVSCFGLGNTALDSATTSAQLGSAVGQMLSASGMVLTSGVLKTSTPTDKTVGSFVAGYYQPDCDIVLYDTLELPLGENSTFIGAPQASEPTPPEDQGGTSTEPVDPPQNEQPTSKVEEVTQTPNAETQTQEQNTQASSNTEPTEKGCGASLLTGTAGILFVLVFAGIACGLRKKEQA